MVDEEVHFLVKTDSLLSSFSTILYAHSVRISQKVPTSNQTIMRSAAILSTLLVGLGCAGAFVAPSPRSASHIGNEKLVRAVTTSSSLSKFGGRNESAVASFRAFDWSVQYSESTIG
jgi:hypothetical protein